MTYFAVLYASSAVFLKVSGFVLSLWMARSLSIESYGTWGLVLAFQTALSTFGLVGIVEAIVNLLKHYSCQEDRKKLFAAANQVYLLTISVSILVAILFGLLFAYRGTIGFLTLSGVLVSGALLAFAALQSQIVRLEERHFASLGFSFLVPLSGLVGSVVCFIIKPSVDAFFIGSAVGLALSLIILVMRKGMVAIYRDANNDERRTEILRRLTPYISIAFFGWLSGYGNNFVVNSFFQPAEVARFTFALSIGAIMQLVSSALNQVWSPRFFHSTHVEPFDMVESKNRRFFFLQSVVLGVVGAGCVALLLPFLKWLGGNLAFYDSMGLELFLVVAGYIFLSPWTHCHNYFLAYDMGATVLQIVLTTSAIGIGLWLALMWFLGPIGIYIGFFMQMVIRSIGIAYVARKLWLLKVSWFGVGAGVLIELGGLLVTML